MTQHELIARLPAALVSEVLEHLRKEQKASYNVAIQTLATQRKFRPVFVEKKSIPERHAWMQKELGRAQNDALAGNILGVWLTGAQSGMLVTFLDSLGIKHDGKGAIEDLPPSPEAAALETAVENLFAKFPAAHVSAYLHAFQTSDPNAWPALGEILAHDERLRLA